MNQDYVNEQIKQMEAAFGPTKKEYALLVGLIGVIVLAVVLQMQ